MNNNDFGFIITRHVNSETTNKYWNQNVKLIRTIYPLRQIIIIDDNSNQSFIKSEHNYKNLTIIQSEYHGRGELLPYIYYLKYKWFPNAVIIHDSVFIHKRIRFDKLHINVLPLWHHKYDHENQHNIVRIASALTNNRKLLYNISKTQRNDINLKLRSILSKEESNLCFGCQCYIKLSFLEKLQQKYNITNLVNMVHNRTDRCSLERVLGLIFCDECPYLKRIGSLFGDIMLKPKAFHYNYDEYESDLIHKKKMVSMVKVWTGR
jgi:hypothetical protein